MSRCPVHLLASQCVNAEQLKTGNPACLHILVLYLGSPSEADEVSALASLEVPTFLGLCLAFLSMWTLGPAAEMIMCPGA